MLAVDLADAQFDDLPKLATEGPIIQTVVGDVSSDEDWTNVIDACGDRFTRLDVLFNNAGIDGALGPMMNYPLDELDRVMAITYAASSSACVTPSNRCARPAAVRSSTTPRTWGVRGSASKHALEGLTHSAAVELAPTIRVNAVCPSPTNTRMMWDTRDRVAADTSNDDFEQAFTASTPMGRFAEAEEIADAALVLAGPDSSSITGAILPVDGDNIAG